MVLISTHHPLRNHPAGRHVIHDDNIHKFRHAKPSRSSGGFLIGNACIPLATIFWGVNVSVTKALIPDWMTANGIAAVRLIGGAVLLWLTSLFVRCDRIKRGDWPRLVLGGVVGLFLFIFLFVTSLRYGNPIDISIIMTLPPVFVILIGVIFQHRRPSMLEYVGVAVSFAGAVTVILAGQGGARTAATICSAISLPWPRLCVMPSIS